MYLQGLAELRQRVLGSGMSIRQLHRHHTHAGMEAAEVPFLQPTHEWGVQHLLQELWRRRAVPVLDGCHLARVVYGDGLGLTRAIKAEHPACGEQRQGGEGRSDAP
jgi:hypothetical protein